MVKMIKNAGLACLALALVGFTNYSVSATSVDTSTVVQNKSLINSYSHIFSYNGDINGKYSLSTVDSKVTIPLELRDGKAYLDKSVTNYDTLVRDFNWEWMTQSYINLDSALRGNLLVTNGDNFALITPMQDLNLNTGFIENTLGLFKSKESASEGYKSKSTLDIVTSLSDNEVYRLNDDKNVTASQILTKLKSNEQVGALIVSPSSLVGAESFVPISMPEILQGIDGKSYFKDISTPFKYEFSVETDIVDVYAMVNGTKVNGTISTGLNPSVVISNYSSLISNNELKIELVAVDNLGQERKELFTYGLLNTAPSLQFKSIVDSTKVGVYQDAIVASEGFDLNLGVTNNVVGGTATIKNEGTVLDTVNLNANNDFKFRITTGGLNYTFEVKDKFGNVRMYNLKDLVPDLQTNIIKFDSTLPTGSITPQSDYTDGSGKRFVKSLKDIDIQASDSEGISKVSLNVNGVSVFSKEYSATLNGSVWETVKSVNEVISSSGIQPDANGQYILSLEVKNRGFNTVVKNMTLYTDKKAPKINEVIVDGEGAINGTTSATQKGHYGFFIQGQATVKASIEDEGLNVSGVNSVSYTVYDKNLVEQSSGYLSLVNGYYVYNTGNDFKGFISINAVDNLDNQSAKTYLDGIITESDSMFINKHKISVTMDKEINKYSGALVFNKDFNLTVNSSNDWAGLKSVEWGITNDGEIGKSTVDSNGVSSSKDLTVLTKDKNIATAIKYSNKMTKEVSNEELYFITTDNTGRSSKITRKVTLDKTAPKMSISYTDNISANGEFINYDKKAILTVKERNFDSSLVKFDGSRPLVEWTKLNDDEHQAVLTWKKEGLNDFNISMMDIAKNNSNSISGEFTIDKTKPILDISSTGTVRNKMYYPTSRVFTVKVIETNFDRNSVVVKGGSISGWSSKDNTHIASISYSSDGDYNLTVDVTDKAGNKGGQYNSSKFVIDKTKPKLEVTGVSDNQSFTGALKPIVKFSDKNIGNVSSTIKSKKNTLNLIGSKGSGSLVLQDVPKEKKFDGIYNLDADIEDLAGNKADETLTFYVNRFGSSFEEDVYNKKFVKSVDEDVVIKENSVTEPKIARVSVTKDMETEVLVKDNNYKVNKKKDNQDFYIVDYNIFKDVFEEDADYKVVIISEDDHKDKSLSTDSLKMAFTVDSQAPDISTSFKDGDVYQKAEVNIPIKIDDNTYLKSFSISVDGDVVKSGEYKDSKKDDKWNSVDLKLTSKSSPQKIVIKATDFAGNEVEKTYKVLVTSDIFSLVGYYVGNFYKNPLAWVGTISLIALLGGGIVLVRKSRKGKEDTTN